MSFAGYGVQASEKLWWPKASTWETSGLNVGYWTRTCEIWFQKRLEAINASKAQIRTATHWKEALKFSKEAHSLTAGNELAARMYLDGHCFP